MTQMTAPRVPGKFYPKELTTAQVLGKFRKELIEEGISPDSTEVIVRETVLYQIRNGEGFSVKSVEQ